MALNAAPPVQKLHCMYKNKLANNSARHASVPMIHNCQSGDGTLSMHQGGTAVPYTEITYMYSHKGGKRHGPGIPNVSIIVIMV